MANKAQFKMTDADRTGVYEYRAPKVVEKVKRVVPSETRFAAHWTRVQKKDAIEQRRAITKAVREIAKSFYPAWIAEPWEARFLYRQFESERKQRLCSGNTRIPLDLALYWQVEWPEMEKFREAIKSHRDKKAYPTMEFFMNKSAKKFRTRMFAECLECYAIRRWGTEIGNERAHDAIVAVLEHAYRDGRESKHKRQTDKRKSIGPKFSTGSRTAYWQWLLGFLHGTDKYKRPKERALAAVTVDLQDGLEKP
jgi:hypothetical protein